jgi:hypothetical protein
MDAETRCEHLIELKMRHEGAARRTRDNVQRRQHEKLAAIYGEMALAEMALAIKKAAASTAAP